MGKTGQIEVLMVEDDPGDVELTREGFRSEGAAVSLKAMPDGVQALRYLRREGQYADAERPDIILLDLNLPRMDGREFLKEIKSDAVLCCIPVVVFTTSDADSDIAKCYELGANCYMTKPLGYNAFVESISALNEFWFTLAKLPPRKD